ncbi:hypothetical protein MMMB2_0624 [Mycobacterium marinum MB2]|nr:hypothetical protein MMMB2_0624 [Mycobacterium marinum MB2]
MLLQPDPDVSGLTDVAPWRLVFPGPKQVVHTHLPGLWSLQELTEERAGHFEHMDRSGG